MNKPTHRFTLLLAVVAALGSVLFFPHIATATPTWTDDTQITANGATTNQAPLFLSGSDGSITAITVETVSSTYSVLARRSIDGGVTWGAPTLLSASGVASADATVVKLNNGHFAVAFAEASGTPGVNQIRLVTSSNNGLTWGSAQTISTAGGAAHAATHPHLAAFGTTELVVGFQQSDGAHDRAIVRYSQSQLQSWTQGQTLSASGSDARFVTPVVNATGDVVVSWILVASGNTQQTQIAGSSNWLTVTTLTSNAVAGVPHVPAVVALPTGAFVVLWADPDLNPSYTVTARISSNAGSTWDVGIPISSTAFPNEITAVVTADGGIAAAWSMGTGGYTYIQTSYSSPTSTPSPSPSASPSSSSSASPWPTTTGAGSAWSTPLNISPSVTGQFYTNPQLALSPDGKVAMVLKQNVSSTFATGSSVSTDNGATWPQGVQSITSWQSSPTSISSVSLVALTGQGFIYGWQTTSNGNPDKGFVRVYGWEASSSSSSTPAPTLPATGSVLWATGLLSIAFFGSGLIFWAVTARSRARR